MDLIPKSESEITKDWIEHNTGLKPIEETIAVLGNVQAGVGFMSNMCRVSFRTEDEVQKNIIVKLLPEKEEYKEICMGQKCDQTEITFYSTGRPQILEVSPELENNFCAYYGGKFIETDNDAEYASMLIMEDLKPAGYHILDPESENWESNLEKVVTFLAKFHVSAGAVTRAKNQDISEIFKISTGINDSNIDSFLPHAIQGSEQVEDILETLGASDDLRESYSKLFENSREIILRVIAKGREFPCLIHGDLWPPNVMVTDNQEVPVKVIDWQFLGSMDPTFELTPVILTCLPREQIKPVVIERFAKLYYQTAVGTCEAKGLGNVLERSFDEFMEFFKTWGIAYGYVWLLFAVMGLSKERLHDVFKLLHDHYKIAEILT